MCIETLEAIFLILKNCGHGYSNFKTVLVIPDKFIVTVLYDLRNWLEIQQSQLMSISIQLFILIDM